MTEQSADWIEQEIEKLLRQRSGDALPGQMFRDYIPAGEEREHPGQGMAGMGCDYVPEGHTAASWLAVQAQKTRLAQLVEERDVRRAIEAAEERQAAAARRAVAADGGAAERAAKPGVGGPAKGHRAVEAPAQ